MAVAPDVIVSVLEDMDPHYNETFSKYHPVFTNILEKSPRENFESYKKTFVLATKAPGQMNNVVHGGEQIRGGLVQGAVKGYIEAPRLIYAFDIPGKTLDQANNKQDLAQIVAAYPDLAHIDIRANLSAQFAVGGVDGFTAFTTLNGQQTFTPQTDAYTGVFQFAAIASQTNTVFGIPMQAAASNPTIGWYHQYGNITSWAQNGARKLREVYWAAGREGEKLGAVPDILLADEASFHNYVDTLESRVLLVKPGDSHKGLWSKENGREGYECLNGIMYIEPSIDLTAFTAATAPRDGVIYGINTAAWKMGIQSSGKADNKGWFHYRPPTKHPFSDQWRYEIILSAIPYCTDLRSQFVITGSARQ